MQVRFFDGPEHYPRCRNLFIAFAGWDGTGAKWFGYPTFWNDRQNAPAEVLGASADAAPLLVDLVRFLA